METFYRIFRIFMIVALCVLIALCLYWGIGDVIDGKMEEAAVQFICMVVDAACLVWWIINKL